MMDADIKKEWLDELRSDEWLQCIGRMARFDEDGELCLCQAGVLAHVVLGFPIVHRKGLIRFAFDKGTERQPIVNNYGIPPAITNFIGLSQSVYCTAMRMNDNGYDFFDIADYLEEYA